MSSTLEQNMRATTEGFIHDFDGAWRPGATMKYRAPECMHTMLPSTLNIPPKNNDEWAARFEKVAPLVSDGKITIEDYIAVPAERRVVCYCRLDSTSVVGRYQNEYVFFLRFDESGEKITEIIEFLDSKAAAEILSKVQEAQGGEQH